MILNDKQILELCNGDKPMISPVLVSKHGKTDDGTKVPSFGLGTYGYDIRIRPGAEVRAVIDDAWDGEYLDPVNPDDRNFVTLKRDVDLFGRDFVLLPAHSVSLAVAEPTFNMPNDVIGTVYGKSTYARNGVIPLVTPLESGWRGDLTLEFSNMSPMPVKLYLGGGVAQILFFRGELPSGVYNGNYQDQAGLTLGRVI